MIKFFRKIRQKLLSENKFIKYLLYAIGEIALVMIGILLALQVNNWNEYRKDRMVEKEILRNLVESLETTIQKMHAHIDANAFCDRASEIVLNTIENKLPYNDTLNRYFGWALSIEDPGSLISSVGYESLKQAGVKIILNTQLRKEIINLFEETIQVPLARKDRMMNYNTDMVRLRQQYFLREKDFNFAPFDFNNLIEDQIFLSWLLSIKNSRLWFNDSIEESLEETQRVRELILNELQQYEE